ncbi:hypothetical protein [Streptomyces sp. NPDC050804]|uniref:hypothetical protein n=1 Tax=Streptomyces sp. NPDC050804 TaxID=3154745 RepID=UPI0034374E0D
MSRTVMPFSVAVSSGTSKEADSSSSGTSFEHVFAHLENWRSLTKLRADPARATQLLRALLAPTNLEVHP